MDREVTRLRGHAARAGSYPIPGVLAPSPPPDRPVQAVGGGAITVSSPTSLSPRALTPHRPRVPTLRVVSGAAVRALGCVTQLRLHLGEATTHMATLRLAAGESVSWYVYSDAADYTVGIGTGMEIEYLGP